jgi:hypothetical protein
VSTSCEGMQTGGGNHMFSTLRFIGKWTQWYLMLRHRNGFGRFHSVRYGLWLARG